MEKSPTIVSNPVEKGKRNGCKPVVTEAAQAWSPMCTGWLRFYKGWSSSEPHSLSPGPLPRGPSDQRHASPRGVAGIQIGRCHSVSPPKQTPSPPLENLGPTETSSHPSHCLSLLAQCSDFSHLLRSIHIRIFLHAPGYGLCFTQDACFCLPLENSSPFKPYLRCLLLPIVSGVAHRKGYIAFLPS